jgi:hypothetical protein
MNLQQAKLFKLKKPAIALLFFATALTVTSCTPSFGSSIPNPLDFAGPEFLAFYGTIAVLDLLTAFCLRLWLQQKRSDETYVWLPALLVFLLVPLGLGKIWLGIVRGRPVGILVVLTAIAGFLGLCFLSKGRRTRKNKQSASQVRPSSGTKQRWIEYPSDRSVNVEVYSMSSPVGNYGGDSSSSSDGASASCGGGSSDAASAN